MRFFITLEAPQEDRQELNLVQQKLKQLLPQARITDNDKLHLTIAFIGEQDPSLKDHLIEVIENAAAGISPFEVTPAYIDGFPHLHTARILWVGVKGDVDKLYRLRHHIKDGLEQLHLDVDERRYVPHIAIAKIQNFQLTPQLEHSLETIMEIPFTPMKVTSIKLFESITNEGFHKHNTLAEIPLIGK